MTLDEAIKTLQDMCTFVEPADPPQEHDALHLGIEALKEIVKLREVHHKQLLRLYQLRRT